MNDQKTSKPIQKAVKVILGYAPLGGSAILLGSSIINSEWGNAIITFPSTVLSTIWAAYSQSFLDRLTEIYSEEGKKGADAFKRITDSLSEAIKWQLAATDNKYLKCQGNECVQYKTEGLNNIFRPQLRDVFVSLELSGSFIRNSEGKNLPLSPGFSWEQELTQQMLSKDGLSIWHILKQSSKNPSYRSLIIQAWGGYGKTTLLRHVTYIYTQKLHRKKAYNAPKLLPVLLYLRKWQELISQPNAPDLPTLIEKYHIPNLPQGKDLKLSKNWAINHLRKGHFLVMFDGFDEVKEKWQKSVSEWMENCLKNYPQTFFILTSRPAGYRQYQSEYKPNTNLFVKPFTPEQQARFLQQWYLSRERHLSAEPNQPIVKAEADRKASSLVQQLQPKEGEKNSLTDFAKNPLLLNMIVNLHSSYPDGELQQGRGDLYRSIVRLQLGDRPLSRQIDMLLEPNESQQILQHLALFMVQENLTKIEPEYLQVKLTEYLQLIDGSITGQSFLKKIEEVSELLVKVDDQYEFAHKSFQEYLAAAEIKRTQQEDLLLKNWQDQWWKAIIILYVAQLRNPSSFIRDLINIQHPKATSLAYECLKETSRQIDFEIEKELQIISSTVQNARYQKLEQLLKNQQFKYADQETYRLMIETVGKEEGQLFDREDFDNFPCEELSILDQLWVKYSKGKFGFSVQKKIYVDDLGGTRNYNKKIWYEFCDHVGWRKGGSYLGEPEGHFPNHFARNLLDTFIGVSSLAQRLINCNISAL
ncbi:GUN4 domain-containing protein [Crocosphaera sp.]|uniref:GUN4 domain-containing protein n=1 Tax=Crocosphaera sp. TaxID=2729996 RepID=UPI00262D94C0|nr:GUN4 domain-containing protein [Crocosphaera sp.]MDJ0578654.1 GUN4 domain-containing protein [Crocosphaera sp.]